MEHKYFNFGIVFGCTIKKKKIYDLYKNLSLTSYYKGPWQTGVEPDKMRG